MMSQNQAPWVCCLHLDADEQVAVMHKRLNTTALV